MEEKMGFRDPESRGTFAQIEEHSMFFNRVLKYLIFEIVKF